MATKSIGTLTAFITADSAQFMKEFNKLDRQIQRSTAGFTRTGEKFALGFIGMESAAKGVVKEIQHVIANVENIPGIPAETTASILTFRKNLSDARNVIDGFIAKGVEFGVKFGQSVGVGAAMIANKFSGIETDTSGLSKQDTPDEQARAKDPEFQDKIREATKRLSEARKGAALAAADEATQIKMLREESQRYDTLAKSSSINTVQRLDAEREAFDKTTQANAKFQAMKQKLLDLEKRNAETLKDVKLTAGVRTADEKLKDVQKEANVIRSRLFALSSKDQNDPQVIKDTIDNREKLELAMRRQIPLLEREKQLAVDVGNAFGSSFESAILSGNKLGDVLRSLAKDLLALFMRQTLINPLASGVSGMFQGLFTQAGSTAAGAAVTIPGKAIGGAVAGESTYMVGEKGPELFVPDSAGRIIPNADLRSGGRGSAAPINFTYNFSSGVTRQELASILPELQRSTIAAVSDKIQRGGSYRKAFA